MKPFANLVGGRWTMSAATIRNVDPSDTNDIVGEYCIANPQDVADAGAAARAASSYGLREQGRYAAEFYTTVKTSYVRP